MRDDPRIERMERTGEPWRDFQAKACDCCGKIPDDTEGLIHITDPLGKYPEGWFCEECYREWVSELPTGDLAEFMGFPIRHGWEESA